MKIFEDLYQQHRKLMEEQNSLDQKKTDWIREYALPQIKELLGQDLCLVPTEFTNLFNTHGKYGELLAFAFSKEGILLAQSSTQGWCDKPIQPYYGCYYKYAAIISVLRRGCYKLIANPIKGHGVTLCI